MALQAEHCKLSKQNVQMCGLVQCANYNFARKGSLDVCLMIFACYVAINWKQRDLKANCFSQDAEVEQKPSRM